MLRISTVCIMIQHVDGNSLYVILDRIRDIFVATYNLDLVS